MKKVIILITFIISINNIFSVEISGKSYQNLIKFTNYSRGAGVGLLTTGVFFTLSSIAGFSFYSYADREYQLMVLDPKRIPSVTNPLDFTDIIYIQKSQFGLFKDLSLGLSSALISVGSILNVSALILFILSNYYENRVRESSDFKISDIPSYSKKCLIYGITFVINGAYSILGGITGFLINHIVYYNLKNSKTPSGNYNDYKEFYSEETIDDDWDTFYFQHTYNTEYIIVSTSYLGIGIALELVGIIFMGLSGVKKIQEKFDVSVGFSSNNKGNTDLNLICAFRI